MTNDKTLKIVGAIAVVGIAAIGAGYLLTHQGGQTTPTQQTSTTPSGQGTTPSGQTSSGATSGTGTTQQVKPPTPQTQQTNATTPTAPSTNATTATSPTQTTPVQGTVDLSTVLAVKSNVTLDAIKKDITENPAVWKVVVGEDAKAADVLGAAEVAAALQYLAKKEETKKIDLNDIKVVLAKNKTIVEGAIPFYKENSKLYLGDVLNKTVPLVTLNSGEVKGDSGDTYSYTVYVKPDNAQITYKDRPDTDAKDPTVMLYSGADTGFVTVEIKFTPALNLTDVRSKAITILGKKFYLDVDDSVTPPALVLRDAALDTQLSVGQSTEFDGHTIKLVDIVSQEGVWYAVVSVDGVQKTIKIHDSETVNGVDVYVENAYKSEVQSGVGYAELLIGGKKYVLENGKGILVGGTDEDDRTLVTIKRDNNNNIEEVDIKIFKDREDSTKDYITAGESYTLPLFDDYKLEFAPVSLTQGKFKISLTPSGDKEYDLSVTDFRGYSKTIPIQYDSGSFYVLDIDKFNGTITGKGTSPLNLTEGHYFAVYNPDTKESYIYKVSRIYEDNGIDKADLTDYFTGQTITITNGSTVVLAGYEVPVVVNATSDKLTLENVTYESNVLKLEGKDDIVYKVTQGDNATVTIEKEYSGIAPQYTEKVSTVLYYDSSDGKVDVAPNNGIEVSGTQNPVVAPFTLKLTSPITVNNVTINSLELQVDPDGKIAEASVNVSYGGVSEELSNTTVNTTSLSIDGKYFSVDISTENGAINASTSGGQTTVYVNVSLKTQNEVTSTPEKVNIEIPLVSVPNTVDYSQAGDYEYRYLTKAGIYVDQTNTNEQDDVYIYVPKEAVSYDISLVPANAKTEKETMEVAKGQEVDETGWYVESISGVPTEYTETTLQPLVTGVAVLDTQVTPADTKLISIGGPNVNRVTADLLGVSYPTKINGLTGGLIKAAELNGRVAVLIMGNTADATRMAAREFALYLTEDKDASAFANATAVKVSGTAAAPTAEKLQ